MPRVCVLLGWIGAVAASACSAKKSAGGHRGDSIVVVDDIDPHQNSFSAYRVNDSEFRFSLGLTSPISLISYRHADGLPAYCRRDAILARLEEVARSRGCDVSAASLGGAPMRLIDCALSPSGSGAGAGACPSRYVAQIWQERWSDSTEDYELEMYARVRTVCAREQDFETFHAPDAVTSAAEQQTDEVTALLAACKRAAPP